MGLFDWILKRKKTDLFIEWDNKYKVDIIEIDAQHQRLFILYNNLVEAMYRGVGMKELGNVLNELLEYTVIHFMTEEAYMEKFKYPELESHRSAHKGFREKVYNLHKDFTEGKPVLTAEVVEYVRDWLKQHVLNVDQRFAPYLKRAGAI
ncbi:MAG: bacteriohemerythrin [Thermodesulfovibrionales bacterium]|nr:bacteriohemerythrin [Thermodesulfovibrionales bacterium]